MIKKIITKKSCRLCNSKNIEKCFSFPSTPLANEFVKIKKKQSLYPLDLIFCNDCYHFQLKHVVNPKILFANYVYVSGTSKSFINHFDKYAKSIIKNDKINKNDLIIEIGSNDGVLLTSFNQLGFSNLLGIEPAKKIADISISKGIPTINSFFGKPTSNKILKKYGKAKIIIANNVLAHIDDLNSVFENAKKLLSKNGFFYFEVSYLLDVINKNLFDTIYHEHLSYHSVTSMVNFLNTKKLYLIDFERVDTHGGSIRFKVSNSNTKSKSIKIQSILNLEKQKKLHYVNTFQNFYYKIMKKKDKLKKILIELRKKNKKIVGYGAPAKMTTLMYAFNLPKNYFKFIIDDSPIKQNLFSPGMNIKVLSSKYLQIDKADVCVVFAWNFYKQIKSKHYKWTKQGGIFINPLK